MPTRTHTRRASARQSGTLPIGPRTPLVAEKAEFSPDLILSDLMFVAAPGREFDDAGQVDRPGVKIGVGTELWSRPVPESDSLNPPSLCDRALGGSRRSVAAKQMCGRRTLAMSRGSPMRSPVQRLYRGLSQPSGRRWRFRKDDHLRLRPNWPRSSTRQRKPVWCERLSNSPG